MPEGNSFEANFPNPLEMIEVMCLAIMFPVIKYAALYHLSFSVGIVRENTILSILIYLRILHGKICTF